MQTSSYDALWDNLRNKWREEESFEGRLARVSKVINIEITKKLEKISKDFEDLSTLQRISLSKTPPPNFQDQLTLEKILYTRLFQRRIEELEESKTILQSSFEELRKLNEIQHQQPKDKIEQQQQTIVNLQSEKHTLETRVETLSVRISNHLEQNQGSISCGAYKLSRTSQSSDTQPSPPIVHQPTSSSQ